MVWGRYCACEILIANPIDWLFAACLEYFIIFSIDSSEARKQYHEYCLSIMQTITYLHDRTHFQCTTLHKVLIHHLSIEGWFKRMELIEVQRLIWAQKGKLYIIYENVMWIQWPTILVWWQTKRCCSDIPNVVSANSIQWIPTENLLSANQLFSLIDMKRKFINSDNHKFHQYQ